MTDKTTILPSPEVDAATERALGHVLAREAALLDDRRFEEWFALLSPAIDYRVPVRTMRLNRDGAGYSSRAYFMEEDHASLRTRVARLRSPSAWSENPPTRTRRLLGSIRVGTPSGGVFPVASSIAVFCYRGDRAEPQMLTAERQDLWEGEGHAWHLRERLALMDSTILGLEAFSIFL